MYSTIGRIAARALETQVISGAMCNWLNQLPPGGSVYQSWSMTASASGYGLNEAPRGAVGHWLQIQNGAIGNYQLVVPSTWNFGQRVQPTSLGLWSRLWWARRLSIRSGRLRFCARSIHLIPALPVPCTSSTRRKTALIQSGLCRSSWSFLYYKSLSE